MSSFTLFLQCIVRCGRNEAEIVNVENYWGMLSYISYITGTTAAAIQATADLTLAYPDTPGQEDWVDWTSDPVNNKGGKER